MIEQMDRYYVVIDAKSIRSKFDGFTIKTESRHSDYHIFVDMIPREMEIINLFTEEEIVDFVLPDHVQDTVCLVINRNIQELRIHL